MKRYIGQRVYEGYALGNVVIYKNNLAEFNKVGKGEAYELERFKKARSETISHLNKLYLDTFSRLGEKEASIFSTYKLMVEDMDFEDLIVENIDLNQSAEFACKNASEKLADIFKQMDDEYMNLRSKDIIDVSEYLISFLTKSNKEVILQRPSIIVCDDLPASELMKFNKDFLIGLVCLKGSPSSHTSILCRMLELPSLTSVDEIELEDIDTTVFYVVDASKGELIVNPSAEEIAHYRNLEKEYHKNKDELLRLIGKNSITKDNKKVKIYANIASSYEIDNVIKNDAEGVGLFRSEFIYLESSHYPSEEEQFIHYKKAVEKMEGKEIIIRTIDIGADKKIDYFNLPEEENPALGYRSIRICKDRPQLFLDQLCALYRASSYGNLSIMIPMIISLDEVKFVKEMLSLARANLKKRNIEFNENMKMGIMIETPAAALISDQLAKEVDFFSIGTNDLSQYTLAIDRTNSKLKSFFNPQHKAILKLIKMTVDNAHINGIEVGICGELARDLNLTEFFLKIGVDELSVSPSYVLSLRNQVIKIDTSSTNLNNFI